MIGRKWTMAVLAAEFVITGDHLIGDEPLPPPSVLTFLSPDKKICAVSDPKLQMTTVFRQSGERRTKLWAMVGWHRSLFPANDGVHLVIGFPGLNLLPEKIDGGMGMVWFVRKGELLETVRPARGFWFGWF